MAMSAPDATLFDAEAVRDALTRPEYRFANGRRVTGSLLSVVDFWHFLDWWRQWGAGEITDPETWATGLRAFLDAVFPPSWLDRLLRRRSVADDVLALPFKRQYEAAAFFFGSLANEHLHVEALSASLTRAATETTTETVEAVPSPAGPAAT